MSGPDNNPAKRGSSFASRKARGEQGGLAAKNGKREKNHGYDARNYHQNANRHGIRALRIFDCPVCDSKNTIRVDLNARLGEGTVRCTYCMSLRPIPEDLPYPYTTKFIPTLENKADVFFRFSEKYNELLEQQQKEQEDRSAGLSTSGGGESGGGARKRPRDGDDGASDGGGDGEGGDLLSGLSFLPTDADGLDGVVSGALDGPVFGKVPLDDHGVYDGADGETAKEEGGEMLAEGTGDRPGQDESSPADPTDDFQGEGVDDVDLEEFFADSD